MKIETCHPDSLIPYGANPRVIGDEAVAKVAQSIEAFGFRVPVVVDADSVIVCGHTRVLAAKRLGLESVPVVVADDLTPEQIRAYRIMDNRAAEGAAWDFDLLPVELEELEAAGLDIQLTGFTLDDLAGMDTDDDDVAPILPEGADHGSDSVALRFAKHHIPMTDAEAESLDGRVRAYVAENGSTFGFVADLLGGDDVR